MKQERNRKGMVTQLIDFYCGNLQILPLYVCAIINSSKTEIHITKLLFQ